MKNSGFTQQCRLTLDKYRLAWAILTLISLFFVQNLWGQGGACGSITFSFEQYEPCKFRARYQNGTDCYSEVRYILESGTFESWNVNTAAGFTLEVISPSELWVHHVNGFLPLGNQVPLLFTLPTDLNTTMHVAYLDDCFQVGCEVLGGFPIESCPDPMNASIIGVKYRECESLPYFNQPVLSGWTIELLNADSMVIAEQVTDANGHYAFYDLPHGIYVVKEVQQPGWSPSVPATGKYTVDLAPSQQLERNFGNCPSCSCDNIYMDVVQLPIFSDTCAYILNVSNNDDYCFNEIDLKVAVGSFASVTPAPGWTATMVSAMHYKLKFPPNYIPAQSFQSTFFTVTGAAQHDITVSTSWNNNGVLVTCSRPFSYQCPPPVSPPPCCPMGSTFGPELVCNPDFGLGNQCFTNDYNYFNPGGPTAIGSYSVLNYGQVYTANNQWACIDHTTYTTTGQMLIVDGYGGPVAWEQQVSVTAGTTYTFSAWFNNLVIPTKNYADPQMALWVNGSPIAATPILMENPDRWEWLCAQYTATQTGLVTLQIRMLATTSIGNDVAIDDVSFKECIPPPSCVCLQPGAFSNMSYKPNSGPNVPISCGQIAFWQCNFPVFNLSGDFMCQGNSCSPMPDMFWTLSHPNWGQVNSGLTTGPGFQVSIPNSSFSAPGLYTLTIAGICGEDTCYCEILIETPGCGCSADFSTAKLKCDTYQFFAIANGTAPFTYCWDFDGNPATCESTVANPTWQFPACSTYTVCLTVTDALNCSATTCHTVMVTDIMSPMAVCNPGVGVSLDPITCTFGVTPAFVDGGSSDDCQIQNMTVSPPVLTGCGDHTVTLTVTDWCGNTSTCTMGIQTLEVVPPDIKCPNDLTVQGFLDPTGICKNQVTGIAPQASDNCGLLGVAYSLNNGSLVLLPDASGTTFGQGATTVTYFAADICQNTASCSFIITVTCEDCECPMIGGTGPELLFNGDFDTSGGFSSGYANNCTNQQEGQYCITSNAANVHPGFDACTDATGPGNILVANGSVSPNTDVLCYNISVAQNTEYLFSFFYSSVTGASPAQLQVYIDGIPTGAIAQGPINTCVWRKHCVLWKSVNQTAITICIRNLNTQSQGNDFAIDKVSFRECRKCAPLPDGAVLWMPMDEGIGDNTINSIVNGLAAIPFGPIGLGNPMPIPGKVDASNSGFGALAFSGPPASPVSVINDPKLNFGSGSFTIDAWVKTNLTTQSAPVVVKLNNQGGYAFGITGTPVTGFPFLSLGTPNGPPLYFQGIHPVTLGQWNFVAVTVQPPVGANPGTVTFYTGGDPGGSSAYNTSAYTFSGATNASTSDPLYVGYNPQNPHIDIAIDELEMFDTALAPAEIKRIWEADIEGKCRFSCTCGGFSKLAVRNKTGNLNLPVACGGEPVALPCYPGQGYHLVGVFRCDGTGCPDEHQISWTLNGPGGSHSGSFTDNDPFWGINLLPTYFNQLGIYTLTMSGDCGTQACSCVVQFAVDCPPLCPCNQQEIAALQANVNKGFAVAVSKASCKACFSPLALSDCETVQWYINSTAGTPIGSTAGKQTFCHTFSAPGAYTIIMVVTRLRPDGSLCEVFTKAQTINITCGIIADCTDSVLPNARFNVTPVPGDLGSGGKAPGWAKIEHWGDPHELFLMEYGNSKDGWVMGLTGSYAGAGILGAEAPLCVSKTDSGTLTMTLRTLGDPIPGAMIKVGRKPPGGANIVQLYTGDTMSWPNCQDASCYRLAVLEDLLPFDDDDWYELRIPYNLGDWAALDSCGDQAGGIPARMAVYVSNLLDEEQQSAGPVRDGILIDDICFRGTTVSTHDAARPQRLRLYPNPNTSHFTLELPAPAPSGTTIRITDLTGRLVLEATAEVGSERQQVQAGALPAGLYFVQLLQEGRVVGVSRFVKQ